MAAPLSGAAVRPALERLVPSGRSLAAGLALLLAGVAALAIARHTPLFAIRTIEVQGAPPALERQVRLALAPLVGESLVSLDSHAVAERLASVRQLRGASYDRAFPNTLRVSVRPDPPVAVLQSGARAWFVSAHGAVLRRLTRPFPGRWPRIWVTRAEAPTGAVANLPDRVSRPLEALAQARRARSSLRSQFRAVRADGRAVTIVLRSGLELRLGAARDVGLKLAVAAQVVRALTLRERERVRYLDVSVPSRPVASYNSKVER